MYDDILYNDTNNYLSLWKADRTKNELHNDKALLIAGFDFVILLMSRQLPGATRLDNGYWG